MSEELFKFKNILDEFGDGQAPKISTPDINPPEGHTPCACGKKFIPLEEIKPIRTEQCEAIDTICNDCQKDCKNFCKVVCITCRSVAARIAPHKDKSGFVFEAGKCYHTPFCPNCQPDCVSSPLAEKVIWDQDQRR